MGVGTYNKGLKLMAKAVCREKFVKPGKHSKCVKQVQKVVANSIPSKSHVVNAWMNGYLVPAVRMIQYKCKNQKGLKRFQACTMQYMSGKKVLFTGLPGQSFTLPQHLSQGARLLSHVPKPVRRGMAVMLMLTPWFQLGPVVLAPRSFKKRPVVKPPAPRPRPRTRPRP